MCAFHLGSLCQRAAGRINAGLHESVPHFSQLAGEVLLYRQTQPHSTGAGIAHESEVSPPLHIYTIYFFQGMDSGYII